eukprot:CAMPEP_0119143224 /NCGR_PEP_ID=MMETSP1310-20130426/33972_1 /TAXON_ID=464262 /ORGANISM="Genus nov. species nov., Strain RCC2339" /LENGTH=77 /DNA_ID=CAMNT_0007134837 /DNA_START=18 /DNA_END=249 /DNA_ORIENTATION=+
MQLRDLDPSVVGHGWRAAPDAQLAAARLLETVARRRPFPNLPHERPAPTLALVCGRDQGDTSSVTLPVAATCRRNTS